MQHLKYWLIAILVAMLLSAAYLLDGPDDVQAMRDELAALDDAVLDAKKAHARGEWQ